MSTLSASYRNITEFDFIFRVMLIGDDCVGKTSLIQRFIDHTFSDSYTATLGIDFKITTLKINGKIVKLQIYDTGGHAHFRSITSVYYRNVDAIILVYDITDIDSFRHIQHWLKEITTYANRETPLPRFLIGTRWISRNTDEQ